MTDPVTEPAWLSGRCHKCIFWAQQKADAEWGECRAAAPWTSYSYRVPKWSRNAKTVRRAAWPVTNRNERCGQFESVPTRGDVAL